MRTSGDISVKNHKCAVILPVSICFVLTMDGINEVTAMS